MAYSIDLAIISKSTSEIRYHKNVEAVIAKSPTRKFARLVDLVDGEKTILPFVIQKPDEVPFEKDDWFKYVEYLASNHHTDVRNEDGYFSQQITVGLKLISPQTLRNACFTFESTRCFYHVMVDHPTTQYEGIEVSGSLHRPLFFDEKFDRPIVHYRTKLTLDGVLITPLITEEKKRVPLGPTYLLAYDNPLEMEDIVKLQTARKTTWQTVRKYAGASTADKSDATYQLHWYESGDNRYIASADGKFKLSWDSPARSISKVMERISAYDFSESLKLHLFSDLSAALAKSMNKEGATGTNLLGVAIEFNKIVDLECLELGARTP